MPKEYAKIVCTIGKIVKDALRDVKREPVPERFDDLLDRLDDREAREPRKYKPR
jgi:hypothetical protein